ncbi:MAG: hypothetical protein VW625_01975 [Perlucidibaca sp.]
MKAVLSMGWQLVRFRATPSDLPYQPGSVLPLMLLNLLLSLVVQLLADSSMEKPVVQLSALALVVEAGWLWLLLQRRGWANRWVQGYSALVLIDTFITLMAAPIALLLLTGDGLQVIVVVLQLVMTLWSLTARAFVYQETLGVPRWQGVLLALAPLFVTMLISLVLFPDLFPAPPVPQGN